MRSVNKAYFVLMAAALVASGCANTEELSGRRPVESKNIGDTAYASDAANQANLYGEKGEGLSSNPLNRPSSSLLGSYMESLGPLLISVKPTEATAFVNAITEIEVTVAPDLESRDENKEYDGALDDTKLVVVLESGDAKANGSLSFSTGDGSGGTLEEEYSNKLVIRPPVSGKVKFRVQTGTAYSDKNPMYYVNVWSANAAEAGSVAVNVKSLPKKSDYKPGDSSTTNDLTPPAGLETKAGTDSATMTATTNTTQQLFVDTKKQLGVYVTAKRGGADSTDPSAAKEVPGDGEIVCWSFVKGANGKNAASISAITNSKESLDAGCSTADENGNFYVTLNSGGLYSAQYYLNFFHNLTSPVTYDISTFALPDTMGTEGEPIGADLDGDGKADEGLLIDVTPTGTSESGMPEISPEKTEKILEQLTGTEEPYKDENLHNIVEDNCYLMPDTDGDGKGDTFVCKLVQDDNGNWELWKTNYCVDASGAVTKFLSEGETCPEGETQQGGVPVITDMDGDGTKEKVTITTTTTTTTGEECTDTTAEDCSTYFTGFDTDGDGQPDILPDPCTANPAADGCSGEPKHQLLCRNAAGNFVPKCPAKNVSIDEDFQTTIKAINIEGDATPDDINDNQAEKDKKITWTLVRGFGSQNNASITSGDTETSLENTTDADGLAVADLNAGTAYNVAYALRVEGDNTHPIFETIRVNNTLELPTGEGDSPTDADLDEAMSEPPKDMPATDPNAGEVVLMADGAQSFTTTIVKTLFLKAKVVDSTDESHVFKNSDVYWKIVRGSSTSNNATLKYTKLASDDRGISSNEFYTGTGYNATYYAIAYHPNFVERDSTGKPKTDKEGNYTYKSLVFTVRVIDAKGPTDGPVVVEQEKCVETEETLNDEGHGTKCIITCKDSQGGVIGYMTEAECLALDHNNKIGEGTTTIDASDFNNKLPKGVCPIDEDSIVETCGGCTENTEDTNKCPAECKPIFTKKNADGTPSIGCLYLTLEGEEVIEASVSSAVKFRARLQKYDGNEILPVADVPVSWELAKGEKADGSIAMYSSNTSESGYSDNRLSTGSMDTKYVVSAKHANAFKCDENGNCVVDVKSVTVSVRNTVRQEGENMHTNQLKLSCELDATAGESSGDEAELTEESIANIEYYVISSDKYNCDDAFPLQPSDGRKKAFSAYTKDRNEPQSATVAYSAETKAEQTFTITDPRENQLVYAVATDSSGAVVGYACEEPLSFPIKKKLPAECALLDGCDETSTSEECKANAEMRTSEACTNVIDKTISIKQVPMGINNFYYTRTLFDFGGIVGKGMDADNCDSEDVCSPVVKILKNFTDLYVKAFGDVEGKTVGETLTNKLFSYFVFGEGDPNPSNDLVNSKDCARNFCKRYDNGQPVDVALNVYCPGAYQSTHSGSLPSSGTTDAERLAYYKELYTNCDCVCANVYYYTRVHPLGETIVKVLKLGLTKAIDNVLGTDQMSLESIACKLFDSVQYMELNGNLTLQSNTTGSSGYTGHVVYSGIKSPEVFGQSIDLNSKMTVLKGNWKEASLVNGKDKLAISEMQVNFAYGNLIYELFGKLAGKVQGAENSENTGSVDLFGFINCDSIFPSNISIPLVGDLASSGFKSLCNSLKSQLGSKLFDYADSKSLSVNIKANGQGVFANKTTLTNKTVARNIIGGAWDGTGIMKGREYDIDGLWVASIDEAESKTMEFSLPADDEAQTIDQWKEMRSICQQSMNSSKKKQENLEMAGDQPSNLLCLAGTFDSTMRASKNYCNEDICKNKAAVVVCNNDGTFNSNYATASKETIIADAKLKCYNTKRSGGNVSSCENNPEVEGWDAPIRNSECLSTDQCTGAGAKPACQMGYLSIVTCTCNVPGDGDSCTFNDPCAGITGIDQAYCFRKLASIKCKDQCNAYGCQNNTTDAVICAERTETVIATWTAFDNGQAENPYYSTEGGKTTSDAGAFKKALSDGMQPDAGSKVYDWKLDIIPQLFVEKVDTVKVVNGTDERLGAVGIGSLEGGQIRITFPDMDLMFTPDGTTIKRSDVQRCNNFRMKFSILGDGRKLVATWGNGGKSSMNTKASYVQYTPTPTEANPFYYKDDDSEMIITLKPETSDNTNKMLRIDEIQFIADCVSDEVLAYEEPKPPATPGL